MVQFLCESNKNKSASIYVKTSFRVISLCCPLYNCLRLYRNPICSIAVYFQSFSLSSCQFPFVQFSRYLISINRREKGPWCVGIERATMKLRARAWPSYRSAEASLVAAAAAAVRCPASLGPDGESSLALFPPPSPATPTLIPTQSKTRKGRQEGRTSFAPTHATHIIHTGA